MKGLINRLIMARHEDQADGGNVSGIAHTLHLHSRDSEAPHDARSPLDRWSRNRLPLDRGRESSGSADEPVAETAEQQPEPSVKSGFACDTWP